MSIIDAIERGRKLVNRRQAKKTLNDTAIGAAVGLTIGAVAGVLLTPQSGQETRKDIANTAKEFPGKTKEFLESAKERLEEAKDKLKEKRTKSAANMEVKK
jgi:gas vesicle protein